MTYRDAQSIDDVESTTDLEEGRRGVTDGDDDVNTVGEAPVEAISENAVRAVPSVNTPPMFESRLDDERGE